MARLRRTGTLDSSSQMGFHLGEIERRCGPSRRQISTGTGTDFPGENAYAVLGVSESSSFTEIKTSFRKLAKATHPDLLPSSDAAAASRRFLQILAAYEILSDSERRAHYDSYLFARRRVMQKQTGVSSTQNMYNYASFLTVKNQSEVVEWLKFYRLAIDDILAHKKVATGSGYFGILENEFYSAIIAAYYGPLIESMDLLPDCFEAEERSGCETSEVLHLVSGRDLFGIVSLVNKVPELSHVQFETLSSFSSMGSELCQSAGEKLVATSFVSQGDVEGQEIHVGQCNEFDPDVYKDLELNISGRLVAMASRVPPKSHCSENSEVDSQDNIHVFLRLNEEQVRVSKGVCLSDSPSGVGSMTLLGTIRGLGTSTEEGSCIVYDPSGAKTHVIMKHRTLLVKHMHWYQFGDEVSTCECRSSRARLPPSKFWLFEPRCGIHDVGGWYIETFGRDKKGRTVLSQRQWDSKLEYHEKRLHPAMYLVALAYRTLDLEDAKRRKRTVRSIIEPKLSSILRWCKKLI